MPQLDKQQDHGKKNACQHKVKTFPENGCLRQKHPERRNDKE
jgi:hypothetical protein